MPELIVKFEIPGQPMAKCRPHPAIAWRKGNVPKYKAYSDAHGRPAGQPYAYIYPDKATENYEARIAAIATRELTKSGNFIEYRAVLIRMLYYLDRPQAHYKTKNGQRSNEIKESFIGVRPATKPDGDNLEKALLDGISKIVINDDNLVADVVRRKIYSMFPRTEVEVWLAEDAVDPREAEHQGYEYKAETKEQLTLLEL